MHYVTSPRTTRLDGDLTPAFQCSWVGWAFQWKINMGWIWKSVYIFSLTASFKFEFFYPLVLNGEFCEALRPAHCAMLWRSRYTEPSAPTPSASREEKFINWISNNQTYRSSRSTTQQMYFYLERSACWLELLNKQLAESVMSHFRLHTLTLAHPTLDSTNFLSLTTD